ncbi:hypothetical protein [Micromonospora luteifusca]|uniref:hypothetical protein n=1 Tax=Micromonospora luteifusca TaxID=709860 RepID=UPI0033B06C39
MPAPPALCRGTTPTAAERGLPEPDGLNRGGDPTRHRSLAAPPAVVAGPRTSVCAAAGRLALGWNADPAAVD